MSAQDGLVFTEDQIAALEKAKADKEEHGAFESEHPGYCCDQDTFYVGIMKGVGRIYQQTFIDTCSKVAFAKLYDRKTPICADFGDSGRVIPFFDEHEVALLRILTDRGTEYCGNPERHEYELYLAVENIDHSRTKTKSPQTNGIVERFQKTALNEFYRVALRKKVYSSIEELQHDLDGWIRETNPCLGIAFNPRKKIARFLDTQVVNFAQKRRTYGYGALFPISQLGRFWPRKHSESDRDPKPPVAWHAHAPWAEEVPKFGGVRLVSK